MKLKNNAKRIHIIIINLYFLYHNFLIRKKYIIISTNIITSIIVVVINITIIITIGDIDGDDVGGR